jgi:hypothetical protein
LGTPRRQYCTTACRQKAHRQRAGGDRNADRNAKPVTVTVPAGGPGHTAEALAVLADLDAELAANARDAGELSPLELSAADQALREMIADAIDRKVWLTQAYGSTEDVALRVKLCTELRLTEQAAARWLRVIDTEIPEPMSRKSQKAQQAANARHHGVHGG